MSASEADGTGSGLVKLATLIRNNICQADAYRVGDWLEIQTVIEDVLQLPRGHLRNWAKSPTCGDDTCHQCEMFEESLTDVS